MLHFPAQLPHHSRTFPRTRFSPRRGNDKGDAPTSKIRATPCRFASSAFPSKVRAPCRWLAGPRTTRSIAAEILSITRASFPLASHRVPFLEISCVHHRLRCCSLARSRRDDGTVARASLRIPTEKESDEPYAVNGHDDEPGWSRGPMHCTRHSRSFLLSCFTRRHVGLAPAPNPPRETSHCFARVEYFHGRDLTRVHQCQLSPRAFRSEHVSVYAAECTRDDLTLRDSSLLRNTRRSTGSPNCSRLRSLDGGARHTVARRDRPIARRLRFLGTPTPRRRGFLYHVAGTPTPRPALPTTAAAALPSPTPPAA